MARQPQAHGASTSACPFCAVGEARIVWSSAAALALWDAFPVSKGHALVVPRRHVASWRDLTAAEKAELLAGVDALRELLDAEHRPDGYNIGCNDGVAAGQTVMHVHLHVIPRYTGDASDPRGGVRWVLPGKAAYWRSSEQ
jgi:diadenosine tetraphosphate (Ap4A) HIT family hydrolase